MRRFLRKKYKKLFSLVLSTAVIISSLSVGSISVRAEGEANIYGLQNPRVAKMTRDTIYFGNYWQVDTNGDGTADKNDEKTPIKWQIIDKYDNGTALIMADKVLDKKPFYTGRDTDNDGEIDDYTCTWKTSTLRAWLNGNSNGDFLKEAFSGNEQKAIRTSIIENGNYKKLPENRTSDKIYLLESSGYRGLGGGTGYREGRVAEYTAFANGGIEPYKGASCEWWQRLVDERYTYNAHETGVRGQQSTFGTDVYNSLGVRPVLLIDLSYSSEYTYGEKVVVEIVGSEWDTVSFGTYNEKQIIWRVLNVNGDDAFLLSDSILEKRYFVDDWKDSDMRTWLNNDFYNEVFSESEKSMIKETKINTQKGLFNSETTDKIFLLSTDDVLNNSYGFSSKAEDTYTRDKNGGGDERLSWWLRSPSPVYSDKNMIVYEYGNVDYKGPMGTEIGVRPALHINLSSDAWRKGKTVSVGKPSWKQDDKLLPAIPTEEDSLIKPVDNRSDTDTNSQDTTEQSSLSKNPKTTQITYKNAGAGIGKISSDGKNLIDNDGNTWFMSSKLSIYDLKKNLSVAVKNSGKYKITKVIKKKGKIVGGNVTYMAPYNKNCIKATVGDYVKIGGVKFNITAINAKAFKNCKKLTTFKAGVSVSQIGKNAFNGCSSLKSITITSTKLKSIGGNAFKGTNAKAKFKVPKSKLTKYSKMIYKAGASKKAKITK